MRCDSFTVAACRSKGSFQLVNFRAVSEADRTELASWIACDDAHRGIEADFWLVPSSHYALYAVADEHGTAMYVRQESYCGKTKMHIQFCPDRKRVIEVCREGLPIVMQDARKRGFTALVFDSSSPALVRFLMTHFRFKAECEAAL